MFECPNFESFHLVSEDVGMENASVVVDDLKSLLGSEYFWVHCNITVYALDEWSIHCVRKSLPLVQDGARTLPASPNMRKHNLRSADIY